MKHNLPVLTALGFLLTVSILLLTPEASTADNGSCSSQNSFIGRVAFTSSRDGDHEIFVMDGNECNVQQLTVNNANDSTASWSPDGSRIVFYSNRDGNDEIYVMNADGSDQTNLTNNSARDEYPSWSPDGSKIVFSSERDGPDEIYIMDADGSNLVRLTFNNARDELPIWSPDGTKIAFRSNRTGNEEIYVMNADGTNQFNLTNNSANDAIPDWSPDGTKIVFSSDRSGNLEIYVMNADGLNQTQLTSDGSLNVGAVWSPDGNQLIFTSYRDGNGELYLMNTDGTNQTRLTTHQADDWWPEWTKSFNQPPKSNAGQDVYLQEGTNTTLDGSGSTDPDGIDDIASFDWDFGDGNTASGVVVSHTYDDDGVYVATLITTDRQGESDTDEAVITVNNVAPTATLNVDPDTINEGKFSTLNFTAPFDPGRIDTLSGFTYSFDCESDGSFDQVGVSELFVCSYLEDGVISATGRIQDKDGGFTDYSVDVVINNLPPNIGDIVAPLEPLQVSTTITATAMFSDPGILDTHTATWTWGDNSSSAGFVVESSGTGTVSGSHTYTEPGVYEITLTVTDDEEASSQVSFQYVVIYDTEGGFVSGGGWLDSPAGALTADPTLTGKANFGFVSKYPKGASAPLGNTEFNFSAAGMNFHSEDLLWLVVNQAGTNAQFKGTGTINGTLAPVGTEYTFMIWATDDLPDTFRIKIWWEDASGNVVGVYDNGFSQPLGGGNIAIHAGN